MATGGVGFDPESLVHNPGIASIRELHDTLVANSRPLMPKWEREMQVLRTAQAVDGASK